MTVICIECGLEFDRPRKSKRQTCSRACWAAFGWKKNPDKRIASIKAALTTPESRARSTEINNRRWAIPGARAKLSAWNRDRWADPATAAALGGSIRDSWTPERRAAFSTIRGRQWAEDEAYRAATVAGIRRSKGAPAARAKFSALLRARWQDPEWRAIWIAGMQRRMADPAERAKFSRAALRRWAECKAAGRNLWNEKAPSKVPEVPSSLPVAVVERELAVIAPLTKPPRPPNGQFSMLGDTWDGWRDRKPRHSVERRP